MKKTNSICKKIVALLGALIVAFSFVFAVVGFFPTTAKTVSAEEVETVAEEVVVPEVDEDEMFDFAPGASILPSLKYMSFELRQKNNELDGRMNWTNEVSALCFELYRYNETLKQSTKKCEILIVSRRVSVNSKMRTRVYILAKEFEENAWNESALNILTPQLLPQDVLYESDFEKAKYVDDFFLKASGYSKHKVLLEGIRWNDPQGADEPHCDPFEFDDSNDTPVLRVSVKVSSIQAKYFLKADYVVKLNDYGVDVDGNLTSPARSAYSVLSAIEAQGKLESEFPTAESVSSAREVLAQANAPKEITLRYLEEIPETYLAVERTATVAVPVLNESIGIDDVLEKLNKQTLKVHNAYVEGFEANADGTEWTALYYRSVHLRTKTVDGGGHAVDMFLDINNSYSDYFKIVATTIKNGQDLYGYMWNELINEYPVLEKAEYSQENVHGFFGVVWIPSLSMFESFNAAAAALFNVKNDEIGFIKAFKGTRAITYTEHTNLMAEYNYSWMSTAWSKIVNFATLENVMAEYYFFVAKPMSYTAISKTGSGGKDDNDGALEEILRDPLGAIGDLLGDFFGVGEGVGGVAKRVSSLLIVLAVGFGIVYVIAYFRGGGKLGDLFKGSGGKKGKKK